MEIKSKIIAVEGYAGGVIIVIQQEQMKLPIAEDENPNSDEAIIARKFARSLKGMGFNMPVMCQPQEVGFKTGFWMSTDEYEELGKPTFGDMVKLVVKVEK